MSIFGRAKDGKEFSANSEEVIAFREKYQGVTLEAAIGSVIAIYEAKLEGKETVEATRVDSPEQPEEVEYTGEEASQETAEGNQEIDLA